MVSGRSADLKCGVIVISPGGGRPDRPGDPGDSWWSGSLRLSWSSGVIIVIRFRTHVRPWTQGWRVRHSALAGSLKHTGDRPPPSTRQ